MRALCWHAKGDVGVDTIPDPGIIKIAACATCGSDLHLLTATSRRWNPAISWATRTWGK